MTKQEAHKEMLKGHKMRHQYYSPEEFVFINANNEFETEDGYSHGGIYDEFWQVYQKWEDGWGYHRDNETSKSCDNNEEIIRFSKHLSDDPYYLTIRNCYDGFSDIYNMHDAPTKQQRIDAERIKPVKSKSAINRNDLCDCGSGKKFKNCHGRTHIA